MNVLVIGCGKVGSKLSSVLDKMGHDVCIVDRDEDSFSLLDHEFSGYTVTGVPIDQDVLRRAGIESCDVVIAVTQDDNVNIMVSQVAREIFHIDNVLTRIYDPTRENVFSHFNLKTVCPTNLTVDTICAKLECKLGIREMSYGGSNLVFQSRVLEPGEEGSRFNELDAERGTLLIGAQGRDGKLILASDEHYILQENDKLVYSSLVD